MDQLTHSQWLDDIMAITHHIIIRLQETMDSRLIPIVQQLQALQLRELAPDCKCIVDEEMHKTRNILIEFCKNNSITWTATN